MTTTDTTTAPASNDNLKTAAAYLISPVSGLGVPVADMPPAIEAIMLHEAPANAADMGNDVGCHIASSMNAFPDGENPGHTLGDSFRGEGSEKPLVGALTVQFAITDKMARSALRASLDGELELEARYMAFNTACNTIAQHVAFAHAIKDLTGRAAPTFAKDALVKLVNEAAKAGQELAKARAETPSTNTVH